MKADKAVINYIAVLNSRDCEPSRVYVNDFKELERKKAASIYLINPELSSEDCWYKMQGEVAKEIITKYHLKPLMHR